MSRSVMSDSDAAAGLIRSAPALPTAEEIDAVHRAIEIARARGLNLPHPVEIEWRVLVDDVLGAQRGGIVYLGLGSRIDLDRLAKTAFHELRHLADRLSWRAFNRAEWEARAERFEREMYPFWRARRLPSKATPKQTSSPASQRPRDDHERVVLLAGEIHSRVLAISRRVDVESSRQLRGLLSHLNELAGLARGAGRSRWNG